MFNGWKITNILDVGLCELDTADAIWQYASEDLRTCDNGGYNAWMCPWGCHTVSFDGPDD